MCYTKKSTLSETTLTLVGLAHCDDIKSCPCSRGVLKVSTEKPFTVKAKHPSKATRKKIQFLVEGEFKAAKQMTM